MWECPRCNNELGEYNAYCEYCKVSDNCIVYNPDKYYVREIRITHLNDGTDKPMTPQEELYSKLFNDYKTDPKVNAMTDLELRAHREELAEIAFKAKAYTYAVDDILKERKPKTGEARGFSRNLNIDDVSSDAINRIGERQKRLTKMEKVREGLLQYMDADAVDKIMSARNIRDSIKKHAEGTTTPTQSNQPTEPSKPIFNPFEKR